MNQQDLAHLLRHVLLCMPRGIWHALDAAADFAPTVLQSSGLTAFQLETLLQSTAILQKHGEETGFNLQAIGYLQTTFPTATPLHLQRHRLIRGGQNNYFVCIGRPNQNNTPKTQLQKVDCCMIQRFSVLDAAINSNRPFLWLSDTCAPCASKMTRKVTRKSTNQVLTLKKIFLATAPSCSERCPRLVLQYARACLGSL